MEINPSEATTPQDARREIIKEIDKRVKVYTIAYKEGVNRLVSNELNSLKEWVNGIDYVCVTKQKSKTRDAGQGQSHSSHSRAMSRL
jgi:hypothetical protein